MTPTTAPSVSVVMPALNEALQLPAVFDALEALDYPSDRLEVILVDNGSTDDTRNIAMKCGAQVLDLPGASIGQLRNLGARRAQGEILAFLDSDCLVSPDWLNKALVHLEDSQVGATGGHTRIPPDATWLERTLDFHATQPGVADVEYLPTANLLMRRKVFEEVGGFSAELRTGEDSDLSHRIQAAGLRLISDTDIHVVHLSYPKTVGELYRKECWHSLDLARLLSSTGFSLEYVLALAIPVAFAISVLSAPILMMLGVFRGSWGMSAAAVSLPAVLPVAIALRKAIQRGSPEFLVHSTAYYTVVLLGRLGALWSIFKASGTGKTTA